MVRCLKGHSCPYLIADECKIGIGCCHQDLPDLSLNREVVYDEKDD